MKLMGVDDVTVLSETLKELRGAARMTVRDADDEARRLTGVGVSRNTISAAERGEHVPRFATLDKLARVYSGADPDDVDTLMALWRLERAREGYRQSWSDFASWMVNRDGVIAAAEDKEARLELIDFYLSKEPYEGKRRLLLKYRQLVEDDEYQPLNIGGRRSKWQARQQRLVELNV